MEKELILKKILFKFESSANQFPRPWNKEDHVQVDYALNILETSVLTPIGIIRNLLFDPSKVFMKSAQDSVLVRKEGNILFGEGKLELAYLLYSASIALAPTDSIEMSVAYGNKSAVLFKIGCFKECLEDIERALKTNYPIESREKLLTRKSQAEKNLKHQIHYSFHGDLPTIKNLNPEWPEACNSIKVVRNEKYGRHVIATKDINPGQILLIEKPFTQICANDRCYCSGCTKFCLSKIPCNKCDQLYCSKACRTKAFVDYHRYECVIFRHYKAEAFVDRLALRMTLKGIKERHDNNGTFQKCNGLFTDRRYTVRDASRDFSEYDHFLKLAEAAKIFYLLKNHTDFFTEFDISDNEVKDMLVQSIYVCVFNNTLITFSDYGDIKTMGAGIYPTLSLFNHACSENVLSFFYDTTVVLKAKKKINKGEQCFINYGVDPSIYSTSERQNYFQSIYRFTCQCQACEESWPLISPLKSDPAARLLRELNEIDLESRMRKDLDKQRKESLLRRTIKIASKLEAHSSFHTYMFTKRIYHRFFADGNSTDNLEFKLGKL